MKRKSSCLTQSSVPRPSHRIFPQRQASAKCLIRPLLFLAAAGEEPGRPMSAGLDPMFGGMECCAGCCFKGSARPCTPLPQRALGPRGVPVLISSHQGSRARPVPILTPPSINVLSAPSSLWPEDNQQPLWSVLGLSLMRDIFP